MRLLAIVAHVILGIVLFLMGVLVHLIGESAWNLADGQEVWWNGEGSEDDETEI